MDNILKCCICGFENEKSILSHVRNKHQMSAKEYKEKFNMPLRVAWLSGNSEYFQKLGKINDAIMTNQPGRATLHNKWSRNFDKCVICGSTERKHSSNGVCEKCDSRAKMKRVTASRNLNIMNSGIEGEDYVLCQICKKPYKILMDYGHLKEHNITSEEYKKLFPNAKTICEKSKEAKITGISNGRNKLMLERGYLNPQSQRDFKRAEMIERHSDKKMQS